MADTGYSWSVDEERYFGDFATVEDALLDAQSEDEDVKVVYVGERRSPTPPEDWWNAEDWLEHVSCQDDYQIDQASDWDESTKEQKEDLESEVRKVMAAWLDRHSLRPQFWLIEKAKKYVVEDGVWVPAKKTS